MTTKQLVLDHPTEQFSAPRLKAVPRHVYRNIGIVYIYKMNSTVE